MTTTNSQEWECVGPLARYHGVICANGGNHMAVGEPARTVHAPDAQDASTFAVAPWAPPPRPQCIECWDASDKDAEDD